MYSIEYAKQAKKSMDKFPKKDQLAILEKIESLTANPRPNGVVRMQGKFAGYYRIRIGNYRAIYGIQDKKLLILILKIARRGNVYGD